MNRSLDSLIATFRVSQVWMQNILGFRYFYYIARGTSKWMVVRSLSLQFNITFSLLRASDLSKRVTHTNGLIVRILWAALQNVSHPNPFSNFSTMMLSFRLESFNITCITCIPGQSFCVPLATYQVNNLGYSLLVHVILYAAMDGV